MLVAFVLFLIIKAYDRSRRPAEEEPAEPTERELLAQIVEELRK